ncbi:MAG: hypothetical protein AAF604_14760 [Acidobacteriota bacterium]
MDKFNLFLTPKTYQMVRIDWAIIMFTLLGLVIYNWQEVNWWRFAGAFLLSDLIGTFPGMYMYYAKKKGEHRSIPSIFHDLYNIGHSFVGIGSVAVIWYLVTGSWEWAMLAMPIHLAGDRCVFGNIYKPHGTAFEPVLHDAFKRFQAEYEAAGKW